MEVYGYESSGVFIVNVSGDVDHLTASLIKDIVNDGILKYKSNRIIIDLNDVNFMDSSGIGMLIGRYKDMQLRNGEIALTGVNKSINKILELSGINKIIKIFDSVSLAINYFLEEEYQ